ncbi:MAG: ATP-binding protein [Terrimesophilobacter sp.]
MDATRIRGSQRELSRVLRNLTDSARNHADSQIRIRLTDRGGVAQFTADDDSVGGATNDRERLLSVSPDLEASRFRSLSVDGFGLGRAIARHVVVERRATLIAHDRADRPPGAEFRIRISTEPV